MWGLTVFDARMLSWCVFIDERTSLLELNATDQKVELVSRLPSRRTLEISFKTKKCFAFNFYLKFHVWFHRRVAEEWRPKRRPRSNVDVDVGCVVVVDVSDAAVAFKDRRLDTHRDFLAKVRTYKEKEPINTRWRSSLTLTRRLNSVQK